MHIDIDILVYAVIAAVLLGWLWAILGSRREDETRRPNPFVAPPPTAVQKPAPVVVKPVVQTGAKMTPLGLPPASLAGSLEQVKTVIASFDEKVFLQESRAAFIAVVTSYAAGDMTALAPYLSPSLLAHFQQAAAARSAEGQTAQSRVIRIRDAEVIAAHGADSQAFVTVRFVSDQENVLRDASGTVIGGEEGKIEEVTDIWVFSRDAKPVDAKWVVVETRG